MHSAQLNNMTLINKHYVSNTALLNNTCLIMSLDQNTPDIIVKVMLLLSDNERNVETYPLRIKTENLLKADMLI